MARRSKGKRSWRTHLRRARMMLARKFRAARRHLRRVKHRRARGR